MIKQHPTDLKRILQSARQLRIHHKKVTSIIPSRIKKADAELGVVTREAERCYKEQSYDTEYHFYIRTVHTGKWKEAVKHKKKAIACAKKRLKDWNAHIKHWEKVRNIYADKRDIEMAVIKQRECNLKDYLKKVERIKKKYSSSALSRIKKELV